MDWLADQQEAIEKRLAARHLKEGGLVLYDLSSSYFEGEACVLAKLGYSRDECPGTLQVNYGLLTDEEGRPVALSVFAGNVCDSKTLMPQVKKVQSTFGIKEMVMVGDRGMITKALVKEMAGMDGVEWITALRNASIRDLVEDKTVEMTLFDDRNLFEVTHPDYPGERLIACRNIELAKRRAHKRHELIEATKKKLDEIVERVKKGKLKGKARIGVAVGKVVNKHKVAKHFILNIESRLFTYEVDKVKVDAEARLDGIYVVRTSVELEKCSPEDVVRNYKRLTRVERAFRCYKTVDLKARPIHHYAEHRVRAHLFLCMLAYYVEWHMQLAWRPLLFSDVELDDDRLVRDPVAPAKASESAKKKARTKKTPDGGSAHSFATLLDELACIVRSTCRAPALGEKAPTFEIDTTPSALQRQALDLVRALPVYPVA
jgi:transposase